MAAAVCEVEWKLPTFLQAVQTLYNYIKANRCACRGRNMVFQLMKSLLQNALNQLYAYLKASAGICAFLLKKKVLNRWLSLHTRKYPHPCLPTPTALNYFIQAQLSPPAAGSNNPLSTRNGLNSLLCQAIILLYQTAATSLYSSYQKSSKQQWITCVIIRLRKVPAPVSGHFPKHLNA